MTRIWLALAGIVSIVGAAWGDEPGPEPRGTRSAAPRIKVERQVVRRVEAGTYRVLVPDCSEASFAVLLKCAPRVYIAPPYDLSTLNQLDALPSRTVRPYPSIFSW